MMIRSAQSLASRAPKWLRAGRACAALAIPLALLSWSKPASAQGWLADRRYTEGTGIRTGDLELHPGIGGEVGYDSNWFLRSHTEGANILNGPPTLPPADAAIFRITPSFSVSTLGQQRLDNGGTARIEPRLISFRAGASATGRFFIGKEMSRQHNVGIGSDARLDINQGRPIGFGIFAGYNRLIQPQVVADPNLSFNRSDLRGGAEIIAIPGGGTLDMRGSYQLQAALFEETNGAPYSSITHEAGVKNRWRFRPRTALFSDTTLRFINYPNAARASNYLNDSTPLRTRLGVTGLITDRFGALLAAGYGATFQKDTVLLKQYDSINAQAEGTFYLGSGAGADEPGKATLLLSTVSLGFIRDFQTSLLGNFYNTNKLYAKIEYWFGGKMVVRLDGFGEQLNYPDAFLNVGPGVPPTRAVGEFTNYRVGAGLFSEYRFTASFGLNTTIDYVQQISDTQIPAGTLPGSTVAGVFDLNYRRFQAFLGARYFF
jgi:hypothetical protein